jgi:hypothetical protein
MNADSALRNSVGLWFSMVGAPFAWVIHFMAMWAITEMGCRLGVAESRVFGIYAAHGLAVLSTVITLALIGASGHTAYRRWKRIRLTDIQEPDDAASSTARTRFMSLLGMLFSVLFAVAVISMIIPVFALPICDIVR